MIYKYASQASVVVDVFAVSEVVCVCSVTGELSCTPPLPSLLSGWKRVPRGGGRCPVGGVTRAPACAGDPTTTLAETTTTTTRVHVKSVQ